MAIPPQFLKNKGKVNPNNDGDGLKESQESPAQKKAEAKNGGKPNANMIRNAKLAQMLNGGK